MSADKPTLKSLTSQLAALESRLAALESHSPDARRLSREEVAAVVEQDQYAEFEVLYNWAAGGRVFSAGQTLRADHSPHLLDYCQAGLALAVPRDTSRRVEELISLSDAQRELASAERERARSLAASSHAAGLRDALDSKKDAL